MRLILLSGLLAALAGCSSLASVAEAWHWDATRQLAKAPLPTEQVQRLNAEAAQLRQQRNDIRMRIASEPDVWARQRLYADLHRVGLPLSRVERQLTQTVATP